MKFVFFIGIIVLFNFTTCSKVKYGQDDFKSLFKLRLVNPGDRETYPRQGDRVKVHYVGTFPDSGRKFDSSRDRGEPFTFTLGAGEVIRCWDMVVSRLSLNERVRVVCPSKLAYGERGAGGDIPPNTDIAFDIEMLGINN